MSIVSLRSVFIGILATVTMDLLSVTASKLGLIAFLPPRLMGRWFAYLVRGEFLHSDIAQMPPIHYEMAMAVPAHYAVGITLAFVYLFLNSTLGVDIHNLAAALGFALCTSLLRGCSCFRQWAMDGSARTVRQEQDYFRAALSHTASMVLAFGLARCF
jgi:hypothetical protein